VDQQRRRAPKGAEPAWRRLERVMEERRTAELLSDFDTYDVADVGEEFEAQSTEDEEQEDPPDPEPETETHARKRKKAR
jgi:hypothetical protein